MDNFKYSLKTHQFNKKRQHIFSQGCEKDSMSLEVHDPTHNVTHLLELNRSQEQSGMLDSKKMSLGTKDAKFFEQQRKTLQFTKQVPLKPKNISHSISTTQKIKLPQPNPKPQPQPCLSPSQKQQLEALALLLYNNESRLHTLTDTINSLYRNTIDLYNNHERKLKELVNNRCCEIVGMFGKALGLIREKEELLGRLDRRVGVLGNTVKDVAETLRVVRIKQECIEALQREQEAKLASQKAKMEISYTFSDLKARKQPILPQPISQPLRQASQSFDFSLQSPASPHRLPSQQFSMVTCNENSIESVQSFISSPTLTLNPKKRLDSNDQKSPFEANELYQISSTVPTMNLSGYGLRDTEYSFRKGPAGNAGQGQARKNLTNSTSSSKVSGKTHERKLSGSFQKIKSALSFEDSSQEIWVDNLSCLRRKNGTYILDQYGNALICSAEQYRALTQQAHP